MNELTRKLLLQDQVKWASLLIDAFNKNCKDSQIQDLLTKAYVEEALKIERLVSLIHCFNGKNVQEEMSQSDLIVIFNPSWF